MKKILIAAICVLAVLIGIIAVDAIVSNRDKDGGTVPSVSYYTDGDVRQTTVVEIPTKDRNAQVQFSMPLHYLEDKYRNDLDLFCRENNYIACTVDEQAQTFTVTMNALNHDLMLISVGMQSIKNIANVIESETYPFLKEIVRYDDIFSEITVAVDKEGYNAASTDKDSFMAFIAGCGIYYQLYTTANNYSCKVIVQDKASGEVLDAKLFQQNNSGVIS